MNSESQVRAFFLYVRQPSSCHSWFLRSRPRLSFSTLGLAGTWIRHISLLFCLCCSYTLSSAYEMGLRVKTSVGGEKEETEFPRWGPQELLHPIRIHHQDTHQRHWKGLWEIIGQPTFLFVDGTNSILSHIDYPPPILYTPPVTSSHMSS